MHCLILNNHPLEHNVISKVSSSFLVMYYSNQHMLLQYKVTCYDRKLVMLIYLGLGEGLNMKITSYSLPRLLICLLTVLYHFTLEDKFNC